MFQRSSELLGQIAGVTAVATAEFSKMNSVFSIGPYSQDIEFKTQVST